MHCLRLFFLYSIYTLYVGVQAISDGEEIEDDYRPIHLRPLCSLSFYFKDNAKLDARHATGNLIHPSWVITGFWQHKTPQEIDRVDVRCGSLWLLDGGTVIQADGHFKTVFQEIDPDLRATLVRLTVPYYGIQSGTSDLAFVANERYMPQGTNVVTREMEHSIIPGFQGLRTNWVGHRVRTMRVRFVVARECGYVYHSTEYSWKHDYLNCYTWAFCELSWWSWWKYAWKSCPSFTTPEKYDEGAGSYPLGTNIMTSVISTTHGYKYDKKLPMGTNIQYASKAIHDILRSESRDDYAAWPEFEGGVQ